MTVEEPAERAGSEPARERGNGDGGAPGATGGEPPERWQAWLFAILALLFLVPIWSVPYLPTVDGPSHLYNAWILKQIGNEARYPLFAATYDVDLRPVPNWFCYAALLALFPALPPVAAEKVLESGYVLLLLFAFWYLAGVVCPRRRWLAFLGFPFVYGLLFLFGFYNFCFSLAFYMLAVGRFWQRRHQPGLRIALELNALLLLCYFSHILSATLALFSIGVLWCSTLRRQNWRRQLLHLPLLAPQLALPLWFILHGGGSPQASGTSTRTLLDRLVHLDALWAFTDSGNAIGKALGVAFGLAVALTLAQRLKRLRQDGLREEDAFLLLALLLVAIYLLSPEGLAGGSILKPRLALYPFLALLPWLEPRLPGAARAAAIGALAALALVNLSFAWKCYRRLGPVAAAYVHTLDRVEPNSRVMPLYWEHDGGCVRVGVFGHMIDYAALDKGLIDWDNYEAMTDLFPVRFKPGLRRPDGIVMEAAPETLPVRLYRPWTDYIFTWKMPDNARVRTRIERFYDQVYEQGPVRLYARRDDPRRR